MSSRRRGMVFALFLLATTTIGGAAPGVEEIGLWPYGAASTVTRDGDLVYFGHGSLLQVLRFTPPAGLEMLSEVELDDGAREIVVHENLLYIAVGRSGVQVVDIGDPTNPTTVSSIRTGGYAYGVAIDNNLAWVAAIRSGIQAFDISNPFEPVRIGAVVPSLECFAVTIADGMLWATSDQGLHAIDIADPTRPQVVSTSHTSKAFRVRIVDHYAYSASGYNGLEIFDVRDPAHLVKLGDYQPSHSQITDVAVAGSTAYVVSYGDLSVVDVSDPLHPYEVGRNTDVGYGPGRSMALDGDLLMVAHSRRGLHLLDVSNRTEPEIVLTRGVTGYQGAIGTVGEVVLLASLESGESGFRTIDVSDPASPTQLGGPVGPADLHAEDMVVIEDHAYVASYSGGVHIFDVQDLAHPEFENTFDEPAQHAYGVAAWNGMLVVAGGFDGLLVYDLTSPRTPSEIGQYDSGQNRVVAGVSVSNDIAYIIGSDLGLMLVDLTDPAHLRVIRQHSDFWANGITVVDSIAYVAAGYSGLIIIDVSNPLSPSELSRVEGRWIGDVTVRGDRAAIRTFESEKNRYSARFLDVSNPALPVERGYHLDSGRGMAFFGDYLALIQSASLHVIDLDRVFEPGPTEKTLQPTAID